MTLTARKKTHVRREATSPGDMRRGPVGEIIMDFVEEAVDFGAPEINVTGVAAVEAINEHQVRVSYYCRRKGNANTVLHVVWNRQDWIAQWRLWWEARDTIVSETCNFAAPMTESRRHSN